MPRPVKYPDGHVFENGFTLLHRTSGGKALFRYASGGTEKEHYIADVAAKKISGERPYQYSDDYQPGDEVGHAGIVLVKFLGNGRGLFRHPDGHECEHQFRHVVTDRIRGYREPARTYTYKVGEQFGPNGFILLSEPKHGEAMFRRPDGSRRTYRIADVASEAVTGKPRGRPKGKRNNYRSLAEKYDFKSAAKAAEQCSDPQQKQALLALAAARKKNDETREKRNARQKEWYWKQKRRKLGYKV